MTKELDELERKVDEMIGEIEQVSFRREVGNEKILTDLINLYNLKCHGFKDWSDVEMLIDDYGKSVYGDFFGENKRYISDFLSSYHQVRHKYYNISHKNIHTFDDGSGFSKKMLGQYSTIGLSIIPGFIAAVATNNLGAGLGMWVASMIVGCIGVSIHYTQSEKKEIKNVVKTYSNLLDTLDK